MPISYLFVICLVMLCCSCQGTASNPAPAVAETIADVGVSAERQRSESPRAAGQELTLEAAQSLALQYHPRLQAAHYEIAAAAAGRRQEEAWRNPTINGEAENVASADGGFHGSEVTLSVQQELPINGALTLAGQAAGQRESVARHELAEEKLSLLADVYLAFHQCLLSRQRVGQLRQLVEISAVTLDKTRKMVDAGKNPQVDLLKVEVAHANVLARGDEAQNSQVIADRKLGLLLCLPDQIPPSLRGELPATILLPPLASYQERLQQHPRLHKWQAERQRAVLQKRHASAQVWPNPEVMVGVRRDYAELQNSLLFGLSLPLPLWNQNGGAIAEAEALELKASAQEKAAYQTLSDELFTAYRQAETARANIDRHQKQILPAARQARELTYQGYEQGKITLFEVIASQQTELDARLGVLQEEENLYAALSALYRLTGKFPSSEKRKE